MIRRQVDQEYWLIAQNDHAHLSGELARVAGNRRFPAPSSETAILGISLHDCGWPDHDDQPTLNVHHQPLDVFETPRQLAMEIWDKSAVRAALQDPYAGLLVSLHMLGLSVFASQHIAGAGTTWDMHDPRTRFEVNRFQHRMIEVQESLRTKLGMRIDQPLKHGLAEHSPDPQEQQLARDYHWLAAMDQLSLCICCTKPPFEMLGALSVRVNRSKADLIELDPWPFKKDSFQTPFRFRRVPAKQYADGAELCELFQAASVEEFTVTLRNPTI
jgi:hypothetical protein